MGSPIKRELEGMVWKTFQQRSHLLCNLPLNCMATCGDTLLACFLDSILMFQVNLSNFALVVFDYILDFDLIVFGNIIVFSLELLLKLRKQICKRHQ